MVERACIRWAGRGSMWMLEKVMLLIHVRVSWKMRRRKSLRTAFPDVLEVLSEFLLFVLESG